MGDMTFSKRGRQLSKIAILLKPHAPQDGRQSETALAVARGTRRLLRRLNYSTITELPLLSGRRADIVALAMDAMILIIEIKSSAADFRADTKWREYRAHCDRFYFAIPEGCLSTSCQRTPGSSLPMLMAATFCGKRRNIAWPGQPAARCSCVLRRRRRTGCIA
jgi:DNA repair protein MmcB-like